MSEKVTSIEGIIAHMNEHHADNLKDLLRKFGGVSDISEVSLAKVDLEGLDIAYNGSKSLRVEYPKKASSVDDLTPIIVQLCQDAKPKADLGKVAQELRDFKGGFGSVCLATINDKGEAQCTYAPIIQTLNGDFIYISEVGEHFDNIKHRPNNVEVMFLEDECKAASVIVRKRLRYRINAVFMERGAEFDRIYDEFERKTGGGGGIKTIRQMLDFHLIRLDYQEGRFVKGFGQAYKIAANGELSQIGGKNGAMPHRRA